MPLPNASLEWSQNYRVRVRVRVRFFFFARRVRVGARVSPKEKPRGLRVEVHGRETTRRRRVRVERLPKTRSGKILRGTMRRIADGEEWKMPATIDDPAILDEITAALRGAGYVERE